MTNHYKRKFIPGFLALGFLWMLTGSTAAWAETELKSEGKFFASKGTKAAEDYEGHAGNPIYEYGKGLQLWQVHVKPDITYSANWDDNIFLEESGRDSDYIHRVLAGLTAELPVGGGRHLLTGAYHADTEWFGRFDSQDHTDNTFEGGVDLNFVPFSLSLKDTFRRTVDRADTEFTTRVPRNENTVDGLLEIPFASFFLETELHDLNIDYRLPEDSVFDHHDFTIYQRVGFDAAPSTQLLVEYGYKNLSYPHSNNNRDGDANQAAIGVRGNFTERLTYQLWGGMQWRIYDDATRPDFNGFILRSALRFDITDKSNIVLKADRSPQESTFDDQSYYVRDRVDLGWRQQIAERLFFNTSESVQYSEYSRITVRDHTEKTRRDYNWGTSLGLEYFMPNELVSFFGEYRFSARESNTALLSYDDQTASVGVRAKF